MSKRKSDGRKQGFIDQLRTHPNVTGIERQTPSSWLIDTTTGSKTAYLHYFKWYKEAGPPGYFQGNWNITESAVRPLYHVFLGPAEESVRVVPNNDLMNRFSLIDDHNGGKEWRLNVNTDSNNELLDTYTDTSPLVE